MLDLTIDEINRLQELVQERICDLQERVLFSNNTEEVALIAIDNKLADELGAKGQ